MFVGLCDYVFVCGCGVIGLCFVVVGVAVVDVVAAVFIVFVCVFVCLCVCLSVCVIVCFGCL